MATQMKAPPSTKKEIVDVPFNYRHLVEKYSPGGRYVDAQTDDDSPWVPFGETAAIKHLAFDVRRNLFSNILWVLVETADVWWMMNHYEDYCKEHGIPINPKLYL